MTATHLNFKLLKQTVSISQVLAAKGLTNHFKKRGDRLIGPCPIHGGDNPSAFVVSISKNLWYCFSRCQAGGDVIDLVRRIDHLSYRQTAARLASLAALSPPSQSRQPTAPSAAKTHTDRQPPQEHPSRRLPTFRPYKRRLFLDPHSPFLQHKGISPATARHLRGRRLPRNRLPPRLHRCPTPRSIRQPPRLSRTTTRPRPGRDLWKVEAPYTTSQTPHPLRISPCRESPSSRPVPCRVPLGCHAATPARRPRRRSAWRSPLYHAENNSSPTRKGSSSSSTAI